MGKIKINQEYEYYQIIKDFGDPLEIFREAFQNAYDEGADRVFCRVYEKRRMTSSELIIDIWNNGKGLPREKVACFFDLANSTKVDENYVPLKGKLGYKGHGTKIFFNSLGVQICSKTKNDYWAATLENPLNQIENKGVIEYSDCKDPKEVGVFLPDDWSEGFLVRIISHFHFNTQHTLFKLDHKNLRDYCKWFTVFGTIRTLFDKELKNKDIVLYLQGLNLESFEQEYNNFSVIDPVPIFETINGVRYELIKLGHYFPEERFKDIDMKSYARKINNGKPYYDYYSKMVFCEKRSCTDNINFYFVVNVEGYETKRRYDILLSRRGKARTKITHIDSERYGIWACKGGVPIEKIDHWIEGGKGTYSFIQAFVDCDDFELTANRGSINNTDIEKLEIIKKELNELFNSNKLNEAIKDRDEYEKMEHQLTSIEEDGNNLRTRYKNSLKKRTIILPNGFEIKEPSKLRKGYSESETLILLTQLITLYPHLFKFKLLDYDTTKGIDFVVDFQASPKYIELKGTMHRFVNHPFRYIYKFICYDFDFNC